VHVVHGIQTYFLLRACKRDYPPGPGPLSAKRPRGGRARPLVVTQADRRPGAPPQWAPWAGREDTEPEPAGRGAQISWLGSAALSIPAADTLPAALCAVRGMNRCALATRMTKISLPKGKYSAHQPAPKHLTNHPMFCSDSIKPIVRAGLGRLSHDIIAVGLRPSYVPSLVPSFCPVLSKNRDLTTGSVQVEISSQVTPLAFSF
jgi:hypothetical protein